jgi:hypothetical protein
LGALLFSLIIATILSIMGFSQGNWFIDSFSIWHILTLLVVTPFFHLFANFVHRKSSQ